MNDAGTTVAVRRAPRAALTDLRFAAGLLFAGAAVFAAVDLAPAPSTPAAHHAIGADKPVLAPLSGEAVRQNADTSPATGAGSAAQPATAAGNGVASPRAATGSPIAELTSSSSSGNTSSSGNSSSSGKRSSPAPVPAIGAPAGSAFPMSSGTVPAPPTATTTTPPAGTNLPSAWELVTLVQIDVQAIGTTNTAVLSALSALNTATATSHWPTAVDGNHVVVPRGPAVFAQLQGAATDLLSVSSPPAAWNLSGDISIIDRAARLLATTAMDDNACSPQNAGDLSAATRNLATGDSYASAGAPGLAVGAYEKAWNNADNAAGSTC